jgi:hypothetical protein
MTQAENILPRYMSGLFKRTFAVSRMSVGTPVIGQRMPDGTVYAGVSPDTGRSMYTTPGDAPLTYSFRQAARYARKLDAYGHHDWRVPTQAELNVLFQNRAAIGGFDTTGSVRTGCYQSSSRELLGMLVWRQYFSDGEQLATDRGRQRALRCIREPSAHQRPLKSGRLQGPWL